MKLVHDISSISVANVPMRLRYLADELEAEGRHLRACVVVLDFADGPLDVASFGRDGDQLRVLGLLAHAQDAISDSIIELGRQDSRTVPPAS